MYYNTIEYKSLKKILAAQYKLKSDGWRDLAVTCVAFTNVQGGLMVIGIEDKESLPTEGQGIEIDKTNNTYCLAKKELKKELKKNYWCPMKFQTINFRLEIIQAGVFKAPADQIFLFSTKKT